MLKKIKGVVHLLLPKKIFLNNQNSMKLKRVKVTPDVILKHYLCGTGKLAFWSTEENGVHVLSGYIDMIPGVRGIIDRTSLQK